MEIIAPTNWPDARWTGSSMASTGQTGDGLVWVTEVQQGGVHPQDGRAGRAVIAWRGGCAGADVRIYSSTAGDSQIDLEVRD